MPIHPVNEDNTELTPGATEKHITCKHPRIMLEDDSTTNTLIIFAARRKQPIINPRFTKPKSNAMKGSNIYRSAKELTMTQLSQLSTAKRAWKYLADIDYLRSLM
eukprot:gene18616-biopygen5543